MNVALFIPCYIDQIYPEVGIATVNILEKLGCNIIYPEKQTCCGQPMANTGDKCGAKKLAERFCDIFESYEYIVCPAASCTSVVRNNYKDILPEKYKNHPVQNRVLELCEFLHDVVGVKNLAPLARTFNEKVVLHKSCHGLRELRLGSSSERRLKPFDKVTNVLSVIEGLELVEPQRKDECCGFGGTFSVIEEDISAAMGMDRINDHLQTGAKYVTGTDSSCLMHMQGIAMRHKKDLTYIHLAQLIDGEGIV